MFIRFPEATLIAKTSFDFKEFTKGDGIFKVRSKVEIGRDGKIEES